MAIDDNTSYELTGAQVKDLANKIRSKAADNIFVGATSAIPGSKGLVPQPQAGDNTKFLSGDGTWKTPEGRTYSAGNGINIDNNNAISIDTAVVAEVSDLPTKTSDLVNDGSDGTSTYVEADSLATVATTGDYTDLSNKPTIPTKTSDLTNDGADGTSTYVEAGDLATVATTGSYTDLSDKPTIPTVNNATLTIQKNGTSVGTFTANASSNKTINITVPTTAADVSALPASTKYGASLSLTIDSTTYKVTGTLKDQDGNTLGTAQTIDLPIESVVVSGAYDSQTKEVVLTLANGSTIRFSVADLVAGLQTEITSTNKLDADLVDDSTSSHKFTTAANLTKLAGIATGAEVNQNAFSNVKVGNTTVAADSKTDTLELAAGSNITLTPDATNDKVTIAATDTNTTYTFANGTNSFKVTPSGGTAQTVTVTPSIADATTSTAGLMSAADKTKLNGIASGAEVNVQSDWSVTDTSSDAFIKNKPTIPTVNNATLTIQKNGTNVQTFTANQSTNATANITVPTKVSELTSDAGGNMFVGTCSTAAATAAKVVTVSTDQNFALKAGAIVAVKFTNTNTASTPTINVNNTGAKNIWYNNASYTGTSGNVGGSANRYIYYMYDGTYWVWLNSGTEADTTYSAMSVSEGTTGTATSSRVMRADYLKQIIEHYTDPKVDIANISLEGQTTTILAQVKDLGENDIHYARFFTRTDGGSSGISDKPTGNTNASFICRAYASRRNTTTDYTYQLVCWVQNDTNPYRAAVKQDSTAISWSRMIPTVNNATLTIQKNGTNVQTFTANQSTNATANITVPTQTSDLTNNSNFVADASYVHTDNNFTTTLKNKLDGIASGAEVNVQSDWNVSDSSSDAFIKNKPTIPTVNNGTLTIQKNGTSVGTFTANQSGSSTANITVPMGVYTATCSTAAATAAKDIVVPAAQNFELKAGATIVVKFTNTNTANNPTFNVNSTGAKSVYFNTAVITTGSLNRAGYANRYTTYTYDGTNWVWVSWGTDDNTTYSAMSVSEGTTGTATTSRVMRADYLKQIIEGVAPNITMTDTDPGAGSTLAANHYVAVYGNSDGLITASDIDMSTISRIMIQGTGGDAAYSANQEIGLSSTTVQLGTGLTRSGNKVVVGAGINYVRVSANVFFSYNSGSSYGWAYLMKNSTLYNNISSISYITNTYGSSAISSILMPVTQGDTIWLQNASGNTVKVRGYASWLTVEQVA